jgi:hypothetical protein
MIKIRKSIRIFLIFIFLIIGKIYIIVTKNANVFEKLLIISLTCFDSYHVLFKSAINI